jgi:hypothetical protein
VRRWRKQGGAVGRAIEPLEQRVLLAIINTLVDPLTTPGAPDATKWDVSTRGLENDGFAGYNAPIQDATGLTLGGTTNSQYWFGNSLQSHDEFSSLANTTVMVDRVSLAGTGTAWRSSLWVLQPGGQYLHFSQNVGETGWQYNQSGTGSATGSGVAIPAFNNVASGGGEHIMKLIYTPGAGTEADVSIILDNIAGPVVHFTNWDHTIPFKTILTGQGRAIGDSVTAVFKNFSAVADPVPTLPPAAPTNLVATSPAHGLDVVLTWKDNANNEVNFRVERSKDGVNYAQVATVGAAAGSGSTVTYTDTAPAAATQFSYRVRAFNNANGSSFSAFSNVAPATTGPAITSLVDPLTGPGVDATKWDITNRGLENNGPAGYNAPTEDATGLTLGGTTTQQYWYGRSLESKDLFYSQGTTTVTVDRVSLSGTGTAYRSSLWLLQPVPGGRFLHFSQNVGENGWQYNPTNGGGGTTIDSLNAIFPDNGEHRMKLVYTPLGGSNATVDIYLDDVFGATATFTNWDNTIPFKVILTGQGRAAGDSVTAVFKDFNASTVFPPPPAAPTGLTATPVAPGSSLIRLDWTDNADNELNYSVERSVDGVNFTNVATVAGVSGTGNPMTYTDDAPGGGITYFYRVRAFNYANTSTFVSSNIATAVSGPIITSLTDPLTGDHVDLTKWDITDRGLENNGPVGYGDPFEDSNGLSLGGLTGNQYWFGKSVESKGEFSSLATTTVTVDRVSLSGSGTAFRSSLWLLQPGGQFLHFAQNVGETGWQYNQTAGNVGTGIAAFNTAAGDQGEHRMKLVYTPMGGTNAKVDIYLDDVLGATANFTNWDNTVPFKVILTGQARATGDFVTAVFKDFSAVATPPAGTTISGTANADTFYIKRDADGLNADIWVNAATPGSGTPTQKVLLSQAGALLFDGLGGNDRLTVDYSAGNPIPAGGVSFNGGSGTDTLAAVGAGSTDALGLGVGGLTLQHIGSTLASATTGVEQLVLSGGTFTTPPITIGSAGAPQSVDVGATATLRVAYTGPSPVGAVRGYLFTGRAGGAWNGPGINSSYAATHSNFALGYTDAGGVITIKPTIYADANVDRSVDFNDLVILAQHYNTLDGSQTWAVGDFNYDGNIDFNDLVLLAQNYTTTAPTLAASLGLKAPTTAPATATPAKKVAPVAKPAAPVFSTVTVARPPQKLAPKKLKR